MTICRFVDAVDAAPGVRFDCNDQPLIKVRREGTHIGPAPLNQAYTDSMLVDGGVFGSSAYGPREITLGLQITSEDDDDVAETIALLNRELDRESNFLMWQPFGETHPVFFETIRAQPGDVDLSNGSVGIWNVSVRLKAKPFALGLRETIGPFTVNNDPAAGSNGCFFDVTGVIGDVPTPAVLVDTGNLRFRGWLAARRHGTPSDLTFFAQAETLTLGTGTANPGGGPDAAMSGAGTNNYVRTTGAGTNMDTRLTWDVNSTHSTTAKALALRGDYRVLVALRRTGATGTMQVQYRGSTEPPVTLESHTDRTLVDLGLVTINDTPSRIGYGNESGGTFGVETGSLEIQMARLNGTDNLDWDVVYLIPADERTLLWKLNVDFATGDRIFDAFTEDVINLNSGDPFDGTGKFARILGLQLSGGLPSLTPNQTNRFFLLTNTQGAATPPFNNHDKSTTQAITVHYWPRYLHVRPVAS